MTRYCQLDSSPCFSQLCFELLRARTTSYLNKFNNGYNNGTRGAVLWDRGRVLFLPWLAWSTEAYPTTYWREICFSVRNVSAFRGADFSATISLLPAASQSSMKVWPLLSESRPDGELLALRSMDADMKKRHLTDGGPAGSPRPRPPKAEL